MKRDMELVREILFCAEKDEDLSVLEKQHGADKVVGHVAIMQDAGLVDAIVERDSEGRLFLAVLFRLTWAGHEFLDNARDNTLWKKTMKVIGGKVASASFSVLTECLKQAILAEVGLS